ncbi:hypothetical protein thsps21_45170 [Pseudomonas sp. No.21]|uniref:hypothetical protein n=1 Tax=Pseudomonas TaxID=286 RepID=UPI000DAA4BCF|nr:MULTISPECIES: hypothetical protein [Pseudomonas]MDW3713478.1 hypothetical protein [Pseudomonas sp. 2023EL-01195]PZE15244.1 hypothetical protein DMX10_01845 [Pseudomonas sp. 57B-090624]GJN47034.1 hypothetical protein TUM20249_30200 [Pseudomonas tohonis]
MFSRKSSAALNGIAFIISGAILLFCLPKLVHWVSLLVVVPALLVGLLPEAIGGGEIRFIAVYFAVGAAWGALRKLPSKPSEFLKAISIRFGLFSVLPGVAFLLMVYFADI